MTKSGAFKRNLTGFACFLAGLAFLSGCARTRPVIPVDRELPAEFPGHTAAQIHQQILLSTDTLDAFDGRASFVLDTPARRGSFSAEVRAREGDSLYISISPGLGIEAARVLITPDSLFLYDRIQNEVTYGSLEDTGDLIGLPVAAEDLYRNLIGITVPEPDIPWEVVADDSLYYLSAAGGTVRYTVDPSIWRVIRYEERTPTGELIEERVFSEFDQIEGVPLPRRVLFRRPLEASTASLYYRSLDLNPASLSFDLRVSESAEWVKTP
jgi:hypothetical protein